MNTTRLNISVPEGTAYSVTVTHTIPYEDLRNAIIAAIVDYASTYAGVMALKIGTNEFGAPYIGWAMSDNVPKDVWERHGICSLVADDEPTLDFDNDEPTWDFDNDEPTLDFDNDEPTWDFDNDEPTWDFDNDEPTLDFINDEPLVNPNVWGKTIDRVLGPF